MEIMVDIEESISVDSDEILDKIPIRYIIRYYGIDSILAEIPDEYRLFFDNDTLLEYMKNEYDRKSFSDFNWGEFLNYIKVGD